MDRSLAPPTSLNTKNAFKYNTKRPQNEMVEKERLRENELHDVEFLVFSRLRLLFQRVKITLKSGVKACLKNYPHFRSNF